MPASLADLRGKIRVNYTPDEAAVVHGLAGAAGLEAAERARISEDAADLVRRLRESSSPGLLEGFLAEYALSTEEGVALMCLAEALLRVPDTATIDALIEDKIAPADWGRHINRSSSSLVNASTWALMLTGKVLAPERAPSLAATLRGLVRRLGEPVVRTAVGEAMKELGRQFVLGRTIEEALSRAAKLEAKGYTYSYDMLGEAARTDADARRYHLAYSDAISAIAPKCTAASIAMNPGISVKLSALHPRYELSQRDRVMDRLVPRAAALALLAASANMGFNIDAEEADRLDLSLDVIEKLIADPALKGWDGFGVVVQAYGPRAAPVLDWLYALAEKHDRRIMVRLVKGAYWDTEIKRAQTLGLDGFPVFTRKVSTDVSYLACARKLLQMTDRIYPQFATHNAHTVTAILALAGGASERFEFQRLHGMGEDLHQMVMQENGTRCRIYAPVGAHRDLLAYLVRRLLENGANSSFVNQIVDLKVPPEKIAEDPIEVVARLGDGIANPNIRQPPDLFGKMRKNSRGWDLTDPATLAAIEEERQPFRNAVWRAAPTDPADESAASRKAYSPADPQDLVGEVVEARPADVARALDAGEEGFAAWSEVDAARRAELLRATADLYEENAVEFFALAAREAGKTLPDGIAEVREAVDFLRYYAGEAERMGADVRPRGIFACISPWNFPLAIFTGQIAAALAAGNAVIAKPAEQTPLIAARAVDLMHAAGIPKTVIQLLPGDGPSVGGPLLGDPRISGVCFTGSTETAKVIDRQMAEHLEPDAPFIAETGGLNAMIVDSTALPEQAVRDIVASAFQSAGQRCSALRMLYVQEDVEKRLLDMLQGAMDALRLGDPWLVSSDIGPVIDLEAYDGLSDYSAKMEADGRMVRRLDAPREGLYVAPALVRLAGIEELEREVFGPILHVAAFRAESIDDVVDSVNARGYGLTFGLHTRIDDRVQQIVDRVEAGNLYVNRNQIGAIVGSQPFGGEKLSGTGPKAGGPFYVQRFTRPPAGRAGMGEAAGDAQPVAAAVLQAALDRVRPAGAPPLPWSAVAELHKTLGVTPHPQLETLLSATVNGMTLPGPTGESNRLTLHPRGRVLCLGAPAEQVLQHALAALALGNAVVVVCPRDAGYDRMAATLDKSGVAVQVLAGAVAPGDVTGLARLEAVATSLDRQALAALRRALARREGPIVQPVTPGESPVRFMYERHLCVDTTAAGGNASLMTAAEA